MASTFEQFKQTKIIEGSATAKEIRQLVEQIRQLDKESESHQFRWLMGGIAAIVLLVATVVIAVFSEFQPLAVFVGAIVTLAVVAAGCFFMRWLAGRFNLQDRRYELLAGLVDLLDKDLPPGGTFDLRVDLRSPNESDKFTHKGTAGVWNVAFYTDPWLQLSGKFMDGVSFHYQMIEKFQDRGRWKTNARGKMKYKAKTKSATEAILQLKAKPSKYPHVSVVSAEAAGALQIPQWSYVKAIEADGPVMRLRVCTKNDWEAPSPDAPRVGACGLQLSAMMFLSLYQVVNLSRAMQKAQRRGGS